MSILAGQRTEPYENPGVVAAVGDYYYGGGTWYVKVSLSDMGWSLANGPPAAVDPSIAPGVSAPIGTLLALGGHTYEKTASADTGWTLADSGSAVTLATAYADGASQADSTFTLDATRLGIVINSTAIVALASTVTSGATGTNGITSTVNSAATSGDSDAIFTSGTFNPVGGSANYCGVEVNYTINQTGGATGIVCGLKVDATETAVTGTHNLLSLRVGGGATERFMVRGSGNTLIGGPTEVTSTILRVLASKTVTSATSAIWDGITFQSPTLTLTGTTAVTTSTGLNMVTFGQPTITDASAVTVTEANVLYLTGPPLAAGSAVLTNRNMVRLDGSFTGTAGTGRVLYLTPTFAPASGTSAFRGVDLSYTVNQTGGANGTVTGIFLNATETAVVGTHNLLDFQVGGVTKLLVTNAGVITGTTTASGGITFSTTTNATKGVFTFGSSTGMTFNESNNRFGIGVTPSFDFHISKTAAFAAVIASSSGGNNFQLRSGGAGNDCTFTCEIAGGQDWSWGNKQSDGSFRISRSGGVGTNDVLRADTVNNLMLGTGALAQGATAGFPCIPTIGAAPNGTPAPPTGWVALAYDTTNNKLSVYNGAWKAIVLV